MSQLNLQWTKVSHRQRFHGFVPSDSDVQDYLLDPKDVLSSSIKISSSASVSSSVLTKYGLSRLYGALFFIGPNRSYKIPSATQLRTAGSCDQLLTRTYASIGITVIICFHSQQTRYNNGIKFLRRLLQQESSTLVGFTWFSVLLKADLSFQK
jgi:hypothetical protein